ncbi:sulfur carrier protein ThiS [Bordetella genomosp. 11]|uniref:Thiamine biosynthesis protein ThiS n=1 Tax=Bordetella genomosp. 11 TaxID=1416808 RepID=A0A261V1H6_9BORD|nr:sulfur carrier protein ThiS [Bordetella genomosp. 11]OZI67380.1 thiamine biosynthesis protein ThiS [Bordetella genomosp. 11]
MKIQLNGEPREIATETTVLGLLELLGYVGKRVAVEKNGEIVPKSQHAETHLKQNDKLEIVVAVGGG